MTNYHELCKVLCLTTETDMSLLKNISNQSIDFNTKYKDTQLLLDSGTELRFMVRNDDIQLRPLIEGNSKELQNQSDNDKSLRPKSTVTLKSCSEVENTHQNKNTLEDKLSLEDYSYSSSGIVR